MDVEARIKLFAKHKNFQVAFELSPYLNRSFRSGNLRARLGLAYQFLPHKKKG